MRHQDIFGKLVAPALIPLLFLVNCFAQESTHNSISKPTIEQDGSAEFEAMVSRGYTPLFNAKDFTGWRNPYSHGEAKVVDDEIHLLADKKFFLVTEKKYADFRLSVEIHLPEGAANSGVMFRCHVDPDAQKKVFGYQAECDGSDRRWSGGLYDEARRGWIWPSTAGRSEEPFLEHEEESKAAFADPAIANALDRNGWNRFVVTCIEDRITIELNGVPTVTFRDTTDASGYLGIQHHGEQGQTYRFRNLFIKELPEIPAEDSISLTDQSPVSVKKIDENVTLVDFGKVAFGNVALRVPRSGRGMGKVHFGEKLVDGRVDREPPGTVRYGVSEFRKGSGEFGTWIVPTPVDVRNTEQAGATRAHPPAVLTPKSWLPVMPFRWVEIEGWEGEFKPEYIVRRAAFASDWNDDASSFECSDETLNRIWELCKYSIKATTFAGVYVDGDRERIPYEADAYLNQLSHYYADDEVEMAAKTFDWLIENGTWPTEWAPHMVFMAHAEWMYSGDLEWLKHRYESLKAKTLMHRSGEDGLVRSAEIDQNRHDIVDWPQKERDGFVFTEINTVVNAFHIEALERMVEMARAIGKSEDAEAFAARAELAKAAFQMTLFDEAAGIYRDGVGTDHSSIHANFFPLAFGLIPQDKLAGVIEWLEQKDMQCSVYAAQYFLDGLFNHGSDQKAIDLMVADGDRSWKHMVNSGTTISWEAWDLKYKPNQDWNHAWGAAPANLLPRCVLGAQPETPGWTNAMIRPCPGGLKYARGRVPTVLGPIEIDWKNESTFTLTLALPKGMTARVELPAANRTTGVFVDGVSVQAMKTSDRWILKDKITGTVTIEAK
ncbi:family 78 glycoside hydrolase catalytic domain [Novipirellula artificiosorum]|uniref:alpha-L-rhamnosidase n=1 Tax=Novipirellula artificiosorum TaxID=2528016 RepID=A0A5C6DTX4_9BACT|nr:family 78 glycoside hydrolase catalytic domain [Novipirellula artificiosorum]TWU39674.1 Bacterial alpha-L-rhamnosidase [Novipirellula artificiosorum]